MATFTLGTDFTSAPRQPSYVNGRLLLADDLSSDQTTLRARDRWIGEAAGSGVVRGLTVTSSATTLSVAPGLGINRGRRADRAGQRRHHAAGRPTGRGVAGQPGEVPLLRAGVEWGYPGHRRRRGATS